MSTPCPNGHESENFGFRWLSAGAAAAAPGAVWPLLLRPAPMPTHLTTALAKMFGAMREVKSAHVAQAVFPDPDGSKRLVIGIETDGDLDFILDRVSPLLDRVAKPSDVIDFVQIPGSPLDGYFQRDVAPFYRKAES